MHKAFIAALFVLSINALGQPTFNDYIDHELENWLTEPENRMAVETPLNWNLTTSDLSGKTLVLHDSQGIESFIRAWQYLPLRINTNLGLTLDGYQLTANSVDTLGYNTSYSTITNVAFTELNIGDNWPEQAAFPGIHWVTSVEVDFSVELSNFQEFMKMTADTAAFDAFDVSSTMIARVAVFNPDTSIERLNLAAVRGATTDTSSANYGNGGSGSLLGGDLSWDESDEVYVIHKGIKTAASLGGGTANCGVAVRKSGAATNNKQANIMGGLLHKATASGNDPVMSTSLDGMTMFGFMGHNGMSALNHLNNVDDKALTAMIRMYEGFDTVLIPMGHNQADEATYATDMQNLAARVKQFHDDLGYDEPKVIFVAMWSWGDSDDQTRMSNQATAGFNTARTNGHGFINLFKTYNGQNLNDYNTTADGDAFTYVMDGPDLHPNASATAAQIADDLFWHFDSDNIVTTLNMGGNRSRDRSRGR